MNYQLQRVDKIDVTHQCEVGLQVLTVQVGNWHFALQSIVMFSSITNYLNTFF